MPAFRKLELDAAGYLSAEIDGDRWDIGKVLFLTPAAHHGSVLSNGPVVCEEPSARLKAGFRSLLIRTFTPKGAG